MGRCFRSFLRTSVFCTAMLIASIASAYPTPVDFDGTLLRWDVTRSDPPILYEIEAETETIRLIYEQAIIDAAEMWNDVETSFFYYAPAATGERAQVTVHLQNSLTDAPFSAGYAVFDEVTDDNKPVHCEVFIGLDVHGSYTDVAKTAMHELGHCFGLGHSLVPESIMGYQLEKNNFELDIDDRAAISRLYPADGSNPSLPPGCSIGASRGERTIPVLLLLIPLYWVYWREQRPPRASAR